MARGAWRWRHCRWWSRLSRLGRSERETPRSKELCGVSVWGVHVGSEAPTLATLATLSNRRKTDQKRSRDLTEVGFLPFLEGRDPSDVGFAAFRDGRDPSQVGFAAFRDGRYPSEVGFAAFRDGRYPSEVGFVGGSRANEESPSRGLRAGRASFSVGTLFLDFGERGVERLVERRRWVGLAAPA